MNVFKIQIILNICWTQINSTSRPLSMFPSFSLSLSILLFPSIKRNTYAHAFKTPSFFFYNIYIIIKYKKKYNKIIIYWYVSRRREKKEEEKNNYFFYYNSRSYCINISSSFFLLIWWMMRCQRKKKKKEKKVKKNSLYCCCAYIIYIKNALLLFPKSFVAWKIRTRPLLIQFKYWIIIWYIIVQYSIIFY